MTTIETEADVIRVIRQNPRIVFRALHEDAELLAEVRRLVLTEELLAMPAKLDEVIETQNGMLDDQAETRQTQNSMLETQNKILADIAEMRQTQNSMLETQNKILADQAETRQTQNSMLETQNKILADQAEMRQTQNSMRQTQNSMLETQNSMLETQNFILQRQDRMETQIGHLRGAELEQRIARVLPPRLNVMYNLYRLRIMQGYGVWTTPYTEPFQDKVEDARMVDVISDTQLRRIQETDLIARARRRQEPGAIYIAVEASATVRQSDIRRAKDAADALKAVFEVESAAVATGYRIRPEDQRRAEDMGVAVIILDEPTPSAD